MSLFEIIQLGTEHDSSVVDHRHPIGDPFDFIQQVG